ncbi:hypothetical protein GCM10010129_77100 [Streptomyces fumigatiscleroticus]|nr:hypothetical protein GCM10010129_77100 [Streptomyces fumigatiscleroticus]
MGEPDPTRKRGPGLPGFAGIFAATSRRPGERDRPHVASRLITVTTVVAVVAAGAIGYGMLSAYQGENNDKHTTEAGETAAAGDPAASTRPKPRVTTSVAAEERQHVTVGKAGSQGAADSGTREVLVGGGSATHTTSGGKSSSGSGTSTKTTAPSAPAAAPAETPKAKSQSGTTAEPVTTGRIVGFQSHRCIDILDGNSASGTPLQIWDCSNDSWQKWTFYSDGTVRSLGKCMQVAGGSTADGAVIQIATCNGGSAQRFTLNKRSDLVNVHADKCVDVKDKKTANGTRLQLWSCAGTANQKWGMG